MSDVTLTFLGATRTVTGSRFLVTSGDTRILVDAGLFQGDAKDRQLNWKPFPIDPATLTAVILTHAHLDHCGYLPLLVARGYSGKIYATQNTRRLAEVTLRDSGRIQEEDAKFAARRGYSEHKPPLPLYTEQDAINAIGRFSEVEFRTEVDLGGGAVATFLPAGHILGAAFVELTIAGKRILFSGDLGRPEHPALVGPDPVPTGRFDALLTESTYGDRVHETPTEDFERIITTTIERGGSVLIPAFAVDRTEVILMKLRELMTAGRIPRVPVFADSPMALSSLDFYREAISARSPEVRADVADEWAGKDPFDPGTLREMRSVEQSKSLNDVHTPCIIVSASGMATGGRVVHHLAHMLPDPKNTVVLVGYQAQGTRGRLLLQGEPEVRIHGEMVPVRAEIASIETFSVHADGDEILDWLRGAEHIERAFVIHGEQEAAEAFAKRLQAELGLDAAVPEPGQTVSL